jgi:hypothetical protein
MMNACDFQGKCMEARDKVRKFYKTQEKEGENSLRMLIDGLMAKIAQEQASKKIENTNEKISYQISLSTSLIRTHYIISDLFMQGDLIEALTLIRKQYESLARLHEIDSKPLLKLHKKTPNVCNIFKKAGKQIYPRLSEVAHFGTPQVGEFLKVVEDGDLLGPSLIPAYHEYALACLDLNSFVAMHFLFWFIDKQKEFHEDFDGKMEKEILVHITNLAYRLGVIRVPEEDVK